MNVENIILYSKKALHKGHTDFAYHIFIALNINTIITSDYI